TLVGNLAGSDLARTLWFISEVVCTLPLIGLIAVLSATTIPNGEIAFLKVHKASVVEFLSLSLFRRYGGAVIFSVLLAFSSVLNEASLNTQIRNVLANPAAELRSAATTRAASRSLLIARALSSTLPIL